MDHFRQLYAPERSITTAAAEELSAQVESTAAIVRNLMRFVRGGNGIAANGGVTGFSEIGAGGSGHSTAMVDHHHPVQPQLH